MLSGFSLSACTNITDLHWTNNGLGRGSSINLWEGKGDAKNENENIDGGKK